MLKSIHKCFKTEISISEISLQYVLVYTGNNFIMKKNQTKTKPGWTNITLAGITGSDMCASIWCNCDDTCNIYHRDI